MPCRSSAVAQLFSLGGFTHHNKSNNMKNQTIRLLLACAVALVFTGCATNKQLYQGEVRPKSEVVTVKTASWPFFMSIILDGKWVSLPSGSTVLPGTYKVSVLSNCTITGETGAHGTLENAGFTHFAQINVPDSFTASAGDTVTYFWSQGQKITTLNNGGTAYSPNFSYIITKTKTR